jgi:hypothetical protein
MAQDDPTVGSDPDRRVAVENDRRSLDDGNSVLASVLARR